MLRELVYWISYNVSCRINKKKNKNNVYSTVSIKSSIRIEFKSIDWLKNHTNKANYDSQYICCISCNFGAYSAANAGAAVPTVVDRVAEATAMVFRTFRRSMIASSCVVVVVVVVDADADANNAGAENPSQPLLPKTKTETADMIEYDSFIIQVWVCL